MPLKEIKSFTLVNLYKIRNWNNYIADREKILVMWMFQIWRNISLSHSLILWWVREVRKLLEKEKKAKRGMQELAHKV